MGCCGNVNNDNKPIPSFTTTQMNNGPKLTQQVIGTVPLFKNNAIEDKVVVPVSDRPIPNAPIANIISAGLSQKNKLSWFIEGVTGLKKCITNDKDYSKEQIEINREACKNCEFSTKSEGKVTTSSQCMAPDPAKDNKPCGCFILCKTQVGKCPLNKWIDITIKKT
jgi:hypothetical protein